MRFLIKTAFWLGLIAFFLPSAAPEDAERPGVNYFGAFLGAQEAISDMGGFCDRSPAACAAGRDVGAFMAARVGDGVAYAYAAAMGVSASPSAVQTAVDATQGSALPAARQAQQPDPMETAAVAAEHVRRIAGLPPLNAAPLAGPSRTGAPPPLAVVPAATAPAPGSFAPAIPTPAPRA